MMMSGSSSRSIVATTVTTINGGIVVDGCYCRSDRSKCSRHYSIIIITCCCVHNSGINYSTNDMDTGIHFLPLFMVAAVMVVAVVRIRAAATTTSTWYK